MDIVKFLRMQPYEFARRAADEIEQLRLAEEGAAEAFAHVVQQKRDLEAECRRLRALLASAHEIIRRAAKTPGTVHEHEEPQLLIRDPISERTCNSPEPGMSPAQGEGHEVVFQTPPPRR